MRTAPYFHRLILIVLSVCALSHLPAAAGKTPASILGELSAPDQAKVQDGQQVMVNNDVKDVAWPETLVYRKFSESPETVAAAFMNYPQMPEINPTVISATLVSKSGPDQVVTYKTKVPVLNEVTYTVRNHITRSSGGVTIHWTVLKSSVACTGSGSIVIQPVKGGSLLKYSSALAPTFPGASMMRSVAIGQVSDSVSKVADYLNRVASR